MEKPAIALSAQISGRQVFFDTAAEVLLQLLDILPDEFYHSRTVLSVNTPARPHADLVGLKVINCDAHITDEYEWVGTAGDVEYIRICNRYPEQLTVETDLHYVRQGYATLSPLSQIVSSEDEMLLLEEWLQS